MFMPSTDVINDNNWLWGVQGENGKIGGGVILLSRPVPPFDIFHAQ